MAAAGAAGIMVPSANRAFGYSAANDRPVFATIGLRNQGMAITNKSFRYADFAALVDVDSKVLGTNVEKTAKRQNKKPDSYKDYRKVLARKDIDVVSVVTPDHWHVKMAIDACRATDSFLDPRVFEARNQPGPASVAVVPTMSAPSVPWLPVGRPSPTVNAKLGDRIPRPQSAPRSYCRWAATSP